MSKDAKIMVVLKETKDGVKYIDSASECESLGELMYKSLENILKDDNVKVGDAFILGGL